MTKESSSYVLGLDLGPPGEPTGFAILERPAGSNPDSHLRHLERFPPGTPYPAIVGAVAERAADPVLRDAPLVVDRTAVGATVIDCLRRAQPPLRVTPVVVTAGHAVQRADGGGWLVPKKELVSCLQLLLQSRRLKVPSDLPDAALLMGELTNFRLRQVLLGDAPVEWREGRQDDLVFAVALACWHAEYVGRASPYIEGPFICWPDGSPDAAPDRPPWFDDAYWGDDPDEEINRWAAFLPAASFIPGRRPR